MNFWMRMLLEGANYAVGDEGGSGGDGGGGAGSDAGGQDGAGAGGENNAGAGAGTEKPAGGDAGNDGAGDTGGNEKPAEFVADPAKTPEENAAAKVEHDKAAAAAKADKAKGELFGAPEKYADFEVPEGVNLDQNAANDLFALGKELNLSQTAIDKLIGIQASLYAKQAEDGAKAWTDTVKDWTDTVKADPTYGGKDYEKNMGLAAHARNTFGSEELNAWLDETQLGSHPELVKYFVAVGQAMGEGKTVGGGKQQSSESAADILYDHPTSKVKS